MRDDETLLLGAVAYDPKVVTIWEGFRAYFLARGLRFDFVLYSNYERQVAGHLAGHFHVAWNSPLAWLEAERLAARLGRAARAVAMRDTDQDLRSLVLVRAGDGAARLEGLRGKVVAVGAADSPQATLIPLEALAGAGLLPGRDFAALYHDALVGKHGEHIGGERDAARALLAGRADAACLLMSYEDPEVRPLLDLEGLTQWRPGRVAGYRLLAQAIDRFGTVAGFLAEQEARLRRA
jgi:phosphonate transport system substrate-binding protein